MGAPKNNKFAVGNKGGRPPKFKTPKELEEVIELYIEDCKPLKMPNKAGFCVFSRIHRDTYVEYKGNKDKEFSDAIKRFEAVVEEAWVQRLAGNSPTGAIFYLKNAFSQDFRDKVETDITSGGEKITTFTAEEKALLLSLTKNGN